MGVDVKVSLDEIFLFVPILNPHASTQIMFDDSLKNSLTLSFDSARSDRKTIDTQVEYQFDIRNAQIKFSILSNSSSPHSC